MAVAVLYHKETNTIHDFYNDVVTLNGNRLTFKDGYADGWNSGEIGVVITNDLVIKEEVVIEDVLNNEDEKIGVNVIRTKSLRGLNETIYELGEPIPTVTDIKDQFIIVSESDQRIADLELMIIEIMNQGGGL